MNYEKDLEAALDNSYTIWSARDEMRKASNDYEDNVTSTVDAYEAAKLNLEYAEESVTNSFRQLYLDVQDKKRLLDEAQTAYDMEKKNFDVDALRYKRGMISKNDYLTAQDDLAAQEDAVRTAEHDLFTAYNTYDWRNGATLAALHKGAAGIHLRRASMKRKRFAAAALAGVMLLCAGCGQEEEAERKRPAALRSR